MFAIAFVLVVSNAAVSGQAFASPARPLAASQASGTKITHFVVDVSGSMAGTKMDLVKESLTATVPQIAPGSLVGMRTFGASGCDTDLPVPIGPLDAPAFLQQIAALSATGSTPLAYGLQEAGNDLRNVVAQDKTIILLNDGDNNCGGDPCQVAADLVASGVDVKVHAVGIQLPQGSSASQNLECIANATGGTYVALDDPQDLIDILPGLVDDGRLKYVALGDSYSSGEGTFSYDNERCHRGALSWPDVMDDLSRTSSARVQLDPVDNRACTGATIADIFDNYKGGRQVAYRSPDESVDLVTITIGGNDVGFRELITQCFTWTCTGAENTSDFKNKLLSLKTNLQSFVYPYLRRAFPNARIVHVGYPKITPLSWSWRCGDWLSRGEVNAGSQLVHSLNSTIQSATRQSGAARIEYLDISGALAGNELCTAQSHVVALNVRRSDIIGSKPDGDERAHPTEAGQRRIAAMVLSKL